MQFDRAGTHYIAVRGFGEESTADTVHIGINGIPNTTSDRILVDDRELSWSSETLDDEVASLEVPSAGVHTLTVWMREDGFMLDRFLLSTSPTFLPHDAGPPESLLVGEGVPDAPELRVTRMGAYRWQDGLLQIPFTPAPGVSEYRLWMQPTLDAAAQPYANAATSGFTWLADVDQLPRGFFRMESVPVPEADELCGLLVNRIAYGPTPDLLDQMALNPGAWLAQQLAPETIVERADSRPEIVALESQLIAQTAEIEDLRAWHLLRAVHADRQLVEVLTQFFSNHFSDSYSTVRNWLDDEGGLSGADAERIAVSMEYQELKRWREILLDPDGTFYDLLKVSAESPAMIIYLDTIENEGSNPNENYARELLELYSMGVDNGYDQDDIEEMSHVWTGWRIALAHPDDTSVPPLPYDQPALVPQGSPDWLYLKGLAEPDPSWNSRTFVTDTNWLSGVTPIGYGDDGEVTVLDDMEDNYSTVYLRHTFAVSNVASLGVLTLNVWMDDGCVIYLNGQEVGRVRAGAEGVVHPYDAEPRDFVTNPEFSSFLLADPASMLVNGTNVLAIHGLNGFIGSRDFGVDAEIIGGEPPVYKVTFDPAAHDPSNKVIFAEGVVDARFGPPWAEQSYELTLPVRNGFAEMDDGYDVLAHIANLPYTMEYMCTKLCQILVHEDFNTGYYYNISQRSAEAELLHACMTAWENPPPGKEKGNLRQVLQVILESDSFRSPAAARQKVKVPFEFVVSAMRALLSDVGAGGETASTDGYDLRTPMSRAGMSLFGRATPDGWPENGNEWVDTQTIAERLRFVQNLLVDPVDSLKGEEYGSTTVDNVVNPLALVQDRLTASAQTDAELVADFFLGLLFPGVGAANLDLERQECLRVLNSGDDGVEDSSPFNQLSPGAGA